MTESKKPIPLVENKKISGYKGENTTITTYTSAHNSTSQQNNTNTLFTSIQPHPHGYPGYGNYLLNETIDKKFFDYRRNIRANSKDEFIRRTLEKTVSSCLS